MKKLNCKAIIGLLVTVCILSLAGVKSDFFGLAPDTNRQTEVSGIANDLPNNVQEDEIPIRSVSNLSDNDAKPQTGSALKVHYVSDLYHL